MRARRKTGEELKFTISFHKESDMRQETSKTVADSGANRRRVLSLAGIAGAGRGATPNIATALNKIDISKIHTDVLDIKLSV